MEVSWHILLVSLLGGLATAIGALIVIFMKDISSRNLSFVLGLAAGIMIAISTFNLMPVALSAGTPLVAALGFVLGAAFMLLLDTVTERFFGNPLHGENKDGKMDGTGFYRMGLLIAGGIALHNLPEGLALGAGYEVTAELGTALAVAIGFHNIPEGIGIAAPLKMAGVRSWLVVVITALAGLFTLVGTLISFMILGISPHLVSGSMGFAAGAMIYIASDELIPQSHRQHSHGANIGILLGILLVFIITNL